MLIGILSFVGLGMPYFSNWGLLSVTKILHCSLGGGLIKVSAFISPEVFVIFFELFCKVIVAGGTSLKRLWCERGLFIYRWRILPLLYFVINIVFYFIQLDLFELLSHRLPDLYFAFLSGRLLLDAFLQLYLCIFCAHFILNWEKYRRVQVKYPSNYLQTDEVVDKVDWFSEVILQVFLADLRPFLCIGKCVSFAVLLNLSVQRWSCFSIDIRVLFIGVIIS